MFPSPTRRHADTLGRSGQFIPISAMVMFTAVMFLVAVANIYKVTRAKLKVQNLADAVALNVASQMASSMNKVTDLNEFMNHMVAPGGQRASGSLPGEVPDLLRPERQSQTSTDFLRRERYEKRQSEYVRSQGRRGVLRVAHPENQSGAADSLSTPTIILSAPEPPPTVRPIPTRAFIRFCRGHSRTDGSGDDRFRLE